MKYDHAKPLIEELMHIAVLFHASGMLRNKIFDALKEFVPDMDDGCFERGCPAIDHFSSHTTIARDKSNAEAAQQEPVAWMCEANVFHSDGWKRSLAFEKVDAECFRNWKPLYARPESRTKVGTNSGVLHKEWVGLTDEEVADFWVAAFNENGLYVQTFASLIEAKLKEKNT
jgi:hypothetical protein